MPRLPVTLEAQCIAGPAEIDQEAVTGTKIDPKTGEEKKTYGKTGKKVFRFHFLIGNESFHMDVEKKETFKVGKRYSGSGQEWFKFLNLNNYVLTELKDGHA